MRTYRLAAAWIVVTTGSLASMQVRADLVTTLDGANLTGTITKITPQSVELDTTYAGAITVTMDQVASLPTDGPITTRLTDETTITGMTAIDEARMLRVTSDGQATTAPLGELMASWVPGATPPPESGYDPRRWIYSVGADIVGRSGNSDETSTSILADAALVTKADELRLYGSHRKAEQENIETSDETILGASYNAFMYDPWGWYVRGEVEKDEFEAIDLRTTVAAGLSYRPINTEVRMLRFFAGLGYRHESFEGDVDDESSPTLDVGLSHRWLFDPWFTMTNDVTYGPALDDFGDYLLVHDSALEMPVGTSRWVLRLGLRNDYKSEPAPGFDELDTSYYTRLLLRFE